MPAAYFAPFDSPGGLLNWLFGGGIGTNLGASILWAVLAVIVGVLIYPPLRRAIHRFIDGKLARLHGHHEQHAQHLAGIVESLDRLHDRLERLESNGAEPDQH